MPMALPDHIKPDTFRQQQRRASARAKRRRMNVRVGDVECTSKGQTIPTPTRGVLLMPVFHVSVLRGAEHSSRPAVGSLLHDICASWGKLRLVGYATPVISSTRIRCLATDEMDAYLKVTRAIEFWVEHGQFEGGSQ
jgi:hypothetical protein